MRDASTASLHAAGQAPRSNQAAVSGSEGVLSGPSGTDRGFAEDERLRASRRRLLPSLGRLTSGVIIPILGIVALVAFWDYAVRDLGVPPYVLPPPIEVLHALESGLLVPPGDPLSYYLPLWSTLSNAAMGFAIAGFAGVFLGALMAEIRVVQSLLMPYFFALQSLPKIAVAPLIVLWFGFGDGSKIALSTLLAVFPIMVNVFSGCRAVEPDRVDLMRSISATRLQTFFYVKLPSAAPYAFAGLNMGIIYAFLGAIVTEFLGAQQGMGVVIMKAQSVTDIAGVFAALVILGAVGISLHLVVRWIEARLIHWNDASRK